MKKKEKTNNKKLIVVIALILLLSVVGLTLAYFVGQIGDEATANVRVTTATVDTLTFNKGADINIGPVTQQNFASGQPNQSGSTTATAMLRANNTTNTANETYNLYVNITNNTFHKTGDNAELILSITDPSGNPLTTVAGLTYTTVTDGSGASISGFDVTEKSGLVQIASDYAISVPNQASNPTTQTWNITLTFVNLDADQSENAGASFTGQAIIQKEELWQDKYWNDRFPEEPYTYYSYPLGQKKTGWSGTWTSGNPTVYSSREDLPRYNGLYIKTTSTEHQLCMFYNNHEFCLGANYWVGDSQDQSDGTTTKTRLQTAMEAALGTTATSCDSSSSSAWCRFGLFSCVVSSDGAVRIRYDTYYNCGLTSEGYAYCYDEGD